MILFLLLLIVAGVVVAVFAAQNTATHDVTLWQWHWSAVPDWVPLVVTAAVIGALFLLYMLYSGMVHGVRVGSMRRRVTTREAAINDMRAENQRLREENARLRSESREPVSAAADSEAPSPATPYRSRSKFGERVRAFFSGREPASY